MLLEAAELHDFRSYERATARFGPRLTVVHGSNGAGKSNLLEAICFACTAHSPRTRNERELIRFGCTSARVEVRLRAQQPPDATAGRARERAHEISVGVGVKPGGGGVEKRIRYDGGSVERSDQIPDRPLVSVFVPERLALVGGPPAIRRSHMDHLITALWPTRTSHRTSYAGALSQRNALLSRIRAGVGSRSALASWDMELARHALQLMSDRSEAVSLVCGGFSARCSSLGLTGATALRYRPSAKASTMEELAAELSSHLEADLERGFTTRGPHRDELSILRDGRPLRSYGSQGERRLALLALLLSERSALAAARTHPPLMILDDVMSELDSRRRELLIADLLAAGGQSLIAATEPSHVPVATEDAHIVRISSSGRIEEGHP